MRDREADHCQGQCIDLALAYTCKRVAFEIRGLALELNTINFTTVFKNEIRHRIGRFNVPIQMHSELAEDLLDLLSTARPCIDERIIRYVAEDYPQFLPVIRALRAGIESRGRYDVENECWGETPSLYRRFVRETLKLISIHPKCLRIFSESMRWEWLYAVLIDFITFSHSPWTLLTEICTDNLSRMLCFDPCLDPDTSRYWKREKYRLSAASAAISFLGSLSPPNRHHVRRIILHEDRKTVSWPECHAQGLIPFYVENTHLRVITKVNQWQNIFPASADPITTVAGATDLFLQELNLDVLESHYVTQPSLAPWIMEASALPSFGMPSQPFTLVLDGSPTLEATAQVFKSVQQDAAWQTAFEEYCIGRNITTFNLAEMRDNGRYIMNGFSEALQHIMDRKTSLVECNFDPGTSWNKEQQKEIGETWKLEDWHERCFDHWPESFKTEPPLPDWLSLRLEEVIPKTDDDSE